LRRAGDEILHRGYAASGNAADVVTDPVDDTGDRSDHGVGRWRVRSAWVRTCRSGVLRFLQGAAEIDERVRPSAL
jgi:hypothetical protein